MSIEQKAIPIHKNLSREQIADRNKNLQRLLSELENKQEQFIDDANFIMESVQKIIDSGEYGIREKMKIIAMYENLYNAFEQKVGAFGTDIVGFKRYLSNLENKEKVA